tara:strand:+ start:8767 stop:9630 length:864 start_codon:yes stop_codon:yes gene_type:complete
VYVLKILILGGNGMIGHQLYNSWKDNHEVKVTLRDNYEQYSHHMIFRKQDIFEKIDVRAIEILKQTIIKAEPEVIVNAVGITKKNVKIDTGLTKKINSKFPHSLSEICSSNKIRLIHLSSDCVFSGKKGNYSEKDIKDAEDTYGVSKSEGEIDMSNVLTIRKSTIGFELNNKHGLLEWFLSQSGDVFGYTNAIFTGLTTRELAKKLIYIIENQKNLSGILHLIGEKIDKYSLLKKVKKIFKIKNVNVIPSSDFMCDRSLEGEKILKVFKYDIPSWDDMLEEMYNLKN